MDTPANRSDLLRLSAVRLRELIGSREVSPVELMDACIERIEAINPAINAIAATDFDRARQTARQAEQAVMLGHPLGALHGLPLGVKDLQETAGLLTTKGNIEWRAHVPRTDNSLVARLRAAGAIVTAKTNVPDMGAGANTRNPVWGATGNPFNPLSNAGGSSGGSAAALATGMLPLCTGSDTGGSLRIPASLCGVVGLRPSPGLVANRSRPLGWSAISVLGPMARTVDDLAFMLAACVGLDTHDPLSYDEKGSHFWPLPEVDLARLRVGYTDDFGFCAVDPGIRRTFRDRVQSLAPRVAVCEAVALDMSDADTAFDVIRAESFVAGFAEVYQRAPESLGPNVRANMVMAESITLTDRARAHLAQTRIARRMAETMERYDVILAPVTPVSPFPWTELYAREVDGNVMRNYYQWLALCYGITLTTNPALSLPCGRDEQGMPFGLQMVGALRGDAQLLAVAAAVERAFAQDALRCRPEPDVSLLAQSPQPLLRSIVTHPPIYGAAPRDAAPGVLAV